MVYMLYTTQPRGFIGIAVRITIGPFMVSLKNERVFSFYHKIWNMNPNMLKE